MIVGLTVLVLQSIAAPSRPIKFNADAIGMILASNPDEGEDWIGTCFAISPRIIATASHVIEALSLPEEETKKKELSENSKNNDIVYLKIRNKVYSAKKVWESKIDEITLLRLTNDSVPSFIPIDFREVKLEETLWVCGFIHKQPVHIPVKVISPAFYLKWISEEESLVILTSPAAWQGTSGSPVLDDDGEAVAIHIGRLGTSISVETPIIKAYRPIKDLLRADN